MIRQQYISEALRKTGRHLKTLITIHFIIYQSLDNDTLSHEEWKSSDAVVVHDA
jgi:hypothetical protein